MLLDRPDGPAESRGFVHKRIIGGIGGFLTGGPGGALRGIIGGGGSPVIPTGPTDFTRGIASTGCPGIGQRRDPRTGECRRFVGRESGRDRPTPAAMNGGGLDESGQGFAHHGHLPMEDPVTVRRCDRGHVLSWQGLCVSKRDIRNKDRMYPKPRKALGTPGELNAVTTARRFSTRLLNNKKSLKKTAQNFAKASG